MFSILVDPPNKDLEFFVQAIQHRHLEVWLSSNLDWENQVHTSCLKLNGNLGMLQSGKFSDSETIDSLYKLPIRSVLEYVFVINYNRFMQSQ